MVLVAPDPIQSPPLWALPERTAGAGDSIGMAKPDLLARLRESTGVRTPMQGLAGGLRAWLEDAAFTAVTERGVGAPPLYVGARRLLAPPGDAPVTEGLSAERVLARLVRALFRQLVTVATIGEPLCDALDALRADSIDSEVVRHVESLGRGARAALAETLSVHAAHLRAVVPRFAPSSMPRTDDRVAIPLAGGQAVLGGVFDLLVGGGGGAGRRSESSLCAIGLTVDGPLDRDRWTLHYLALLETLRSGTPPFRLALLHSATGAFGVEDVREEHLRAVAAHVARWLGGVGTGTDD
jgi:hypothetical protein